jgi:uncharacterized protein
MQPAHARSGLEIIPHKECLRLLGTQRLGRLGFIVDGYPMVLPVNYAIQGDVVVFRTGEGTKLDAAVGTRVTMEIDEVDQRTGTGWSVVVQGMARDITDDTDWFAESLRQAAAPTSLPEPPDHYVRIDPTQISGRRLPARTPD